MALRSFGRRPKAAEEDAGPAPAPPAGAAAAAPAAAVPLRPQTSDAMVADIAARVHPVIAKALDMAQAVKLKPEDLAAQLQAFPRDRGGRCHRTHAAGPAARGRLPDQRHQGPGAA